MRIIPAFILACLLLPTAAQARIPVGPKAIMAMAFLGGATEWGDGYRAGTNTFTSAEAEADITKHIADAAAAGVSVFLLDMASSNSAAHLWRVIRWNNAARAYNTVNQDSPVCIAPMYESAAALTGTSDGALPIFDAADAGGAASPLCTMDSSGQKPVVATLAATCINPMTAISARGPFVMIGTVTAGAGIPDATCVSSWLAGGASKVFGYLSMAANPAAVTGLTQSMADITAAGATPILGIGTAHSRGCGNGGISREADNFELTDFNYFEAYQRAWMFAIGANLEHVMYTSAAPGDDGSYRGSSLVCGAGDAATHASAIGSINHGFNCPAVPDAFRSALPSGGARSTSLPLWTHRGFNATDKFFSEWFVTGVEPVTHAPFITFAYRQHDAMGSLSGMQVCPEAQSLLMPASLGGQYWGHKIAVTSWGPAVRLRVRLGAETLFDGTLPASQIKAADSTRQTIIDIGSRQGRPIFEVLNAAGDIVASKEGLLNITSTPLHWGNQTGKNQGLYADWFPFSSGGFAGIYLGTGGDVEDNVVQDVDGFGIRLFDLADNVDVIGNTVRDAADGISVGSAAGSGLGRSMVVANNAVVGSGRTGIRVDGDVGADAVFTNNLLWSNALDMATSVSAIAASTVAQDPDFISATDARLQETSPAIDAGSASWNTGIDLDGRSRGAQPDIGAFEFHDPDLRSPCTVPGAPLPDPEPEPLPAGACPVPPTLISPQNIVVGAAGAQINLGEFQDAMITCNAVVKTSIKITGGRNVHVRGCSILQDWVTTPAGETRAFGVLGTKKIYIEGVRIDAADRCDMFTLQPNHNTAISWENDFIDVTIVNSFGENNNYNRIGTCHGDFVQVQGHLQERGGRGGVKMNFYNLTLKSKAQGFFIPDRSNTSTGFSATFSRVNLGWGIDGVPRYEIHRGDEGGITQLYFFGSAALDTKKWPVTLGPDVYLDWRNSNRNISPGAATGTQSYVNLTDPNKITFTPSSLITGEIKKGAPPNGDFAPRELVGAGYNRSNFCTN